MEVGLAFHCAVDYIGIHCRLDQIGFRRALDSPRLGWTRWRLRPVWTPLCAWFYSARLGSAVD
eukprot:8082183-Lingulodinium_polyedra.AAC.1